MKTTRNKSSSAFYQRPACDTRVALFVCRERDASKPAGHVPCSRRRRREECEERKQ